MSRIFFLGHAVKAGGRHSAAGARLLQVVTFLLLLARINPAWSDCPAGQAPTGPNGACLCVNGTAPLQGACVVLVCQPGQPMTASGLCCAPSTVPEPNNTCVPAWLAPPAAAVTCPDFEVSGPNGACVCLNGKPPPAGGCPDPHICLLSASCCPAGQATSNGTCCPQGQIPLSDGSCGTFDQQVSIILANQGLCPPAQTLQPDGTCLGYPQTSACTYVPPLPVSPVGGTLPGPAPCCLPGQAPATTGVPPSATGTGTLKYTGTCCPVGQVPTANGSCTPYEPWIATCPGGAPFNARTNSCCPVGTSSITNHYVCCPTGLAPQPNGTCGCPPNTMTQSNGSCAPECPPNMTVTGQSCTMCPSGQVAALQNNVCCDPQSLTSSSYCCPTDFVAVGNACVSSTEMRRVKDKPPNLTYTLLAVRPRDQVQCASGLVPREAFAGDRACVTPAVHDQAIADNVAVPTRSKPDGNCIRGYVWREARPSDHVCVLPAIRAQTRRDNARASCPTGACAQPPNCPPPLVLRDGTCTAAVAPAHPAGLTTHTPRLRNRTPVARQLRDTRASTVQRTISHAPRGRGGRRL